jgi:hypothetical protein
MPNPGIRKAESKRYKRILGVAITGRHLAKTVPRFETTDSNYCLTSKIQSARRTKRRKIIASKG